MRAVRMGGPIVLIVLGLILALAVRDSINAIDLTMIGWILAGAGAVWLVLELVMNGRRTAVTQESTTVQGAHGAETVDREVRHDV